MAGRADGGAGRERAGEAAAAREGAAPEESEETARAQMAPAAFVAVPIPHTLMDEAPVRDAGRSDAPVTGQPAVQLGPALVVDATDVRAPPVTGMPVVAEPTVGIPVGPAATAAGGTLAEGFPVPARRSSQAADRGALDQLDMDEVEVLRLARLVRWFSVVDTFLCLAAVLDRGPFWPFILLVPLPIAGFRSTQRLDPTLAFVYLCFCFANLTRYIVYISIGRYFGAQTVLVVFLVAIGIYITRTVARFYVMLKRLSPEALANLRAIFILSAAQTILPVASPSHRGGRGRNVSAWPYAGAPPPPALIEALVAAGAHPSVDGRNHHRSTSRPRNSVQHPRGVRASRERGRELGQRDHERIVAMRVQFRTRQQIAQHV